MSNELQHAIVADCVFDGTTVHRNAAVVVEGPRIAALLRRADLPARVPVRVLPDGAWLAPGFVDLQVNGGGDVLFNDSPTSEGIRAIAATHRRYGTTAFLPTLISDTPQKTKAALDAVHQTVTSDSSVIGIHLEGPFLSPERPGVHALRHIRKPSADDLATLAAPRRGVMLLTLAPEQAPPGFVRQLANAGIRISLGHSMATYAQTRAAMAEGLAGFTHLFNAMRPLTSREPGPIAAALESPDAWFGMIVDGVHVDPAMLRLALRGAATPMLVTDAMPPVGGSRASFPLYGEDIVVADGKCLRGDGTLAGAVLDMATAVRNSVRLLGVSLELALQAAATYPADFIGVGHWLGRLAPGYRADLVAINPDSIEVLQTWTVGQDATVAQSR
jgi:N-acetylglucosamine-6-phosphate deacetylase